LPKKRVVGMRFPPSCAIAAYARYNVHNLHKDSTTLDMRETKKKAKAE